MFNRILEIIEGDDEDNSIFGLLRLIRFDIDPNEKRRPFEKHVATSNTVEDAKGNPGCIGSFFLSNLRFVWQMRLDNYVNLSCGLESIVSLEVKTTPVQWGSGFKHNLIVKAQNQSQTRYEFRFVSTNQEDLKIFEKMIQIRKQVMNTKSFRCTNLAVKFEKEYEAMDGEQLKAEYNNIVYIEDGNKCSCKIFLTNVRLVIVKENEKKMNMGIVWLMIKSVEPEEHDDMRGLRLYCRGLLATKEMYVLSAKPQDAKKLEFQMKSFCELYNKAPILGYNVDEQPEPISKQQQIEQIQELQGTKVNLVRRKNAYTSSSGAGKIQNTEFNAELGLMIEKLPEGVTREDLWEIIK